ncbi:GNAT family N-acetyltransferase [Deinococcus altitudinis]|uniref:GNAT family N-acetyltransferase n=1 Tax=Deinococcus altitudinis TaxID=468914 RepID=UPI00389274B4
MLELGPDLCLRPAQASDESLLQQIYLSTRSTELQTVPWSAQQKQEFLSFQAAAQERHYRQTYPDIEQLVVEYRGVPAGRLYRSQDMLEHRLIDVALLPAFTGQGLGTRLLEGEMGRAGAAGKQLRLHVERHNPARRLYERLGFVMTEDQGVYLAMTWNQSPA